MTWATRNEVKRLYGTLSEDCKQPSPSPSHALAARFLQDYQLEILDADGAPLPLSAVYNHHYILALGRRGAMEEFRKRINGFFGPRGERAKA